MVGIRQTVGIAAIVSYIILVFSVHIKTEIQL